MESGSYASLDDMPDYISGKSPEKWEKQVKDFVQKRYGDLSSSNGFPPGGTIRSIRDGYPEKLLSKLSKDITDSYCGCGFPFESIEFSNFQTVVDLGCGVGLDSLLVSDFLENKGRVISLDFAFPMVNKLQKSIDKNGKKNIFPILGDMEKIPFKDEFADFLFANASFNLIVKKKIAFSEAYRILKPKGKLILRELALKNSLPDEIEQDPSAWNSSLGGVISKSDWLELLTNVGFTDIRISDEKDFSPVISLKIQAYK